MEVESYKILEIDPYLVPYKNDIAQQMRRYQEMKNRLVNGAGSLGEIANGSLYFGFHRQPDGWYYREWAPNAAEIALFGEFNNWDRQSHKLTRMGEGNWEIFLPGADALAHGTKVKIQITTRDGEVLERIPLYCRRVVQDAGNNMFDGMVWCPPEPFGWTDAEFKLPENQPLLIYECHVGMSGEADGIASYRDFARVVLPRAKKLGYNTIQLMAVMEHPYYGSFGYQVSNFYAVSSRFGTPEDLKYLVNKAHKLGIAVLLDLVHSHAARNEQEGIARFDGTAYQFFHEGPKGDHPQWGTKLFNYGKPEVLHFLLSNLKYWLEEYHFDGFRFDGVTSMLYLDHGLGGIFNHYDKYFSANTDTEAVTYLQLAADLCKEVRPGCVLIAEDMSGRPGMCIPLRDGGIGFDYRLSMGVPDFWVRTLKHKRDEDWNMGELWHELSQRRPQEKVVGYCESHDQALVGDKTIMFWLADKEMYWHMNTGSQNPAIDRAMSLHKMIRLICCVCAGEGYLNFFGNEFGHPEWIDFPREGNNWSYHYAKRLWSLADDPALRYHFLQDFDKDMIHLVKRYNLTAFLPRLVLHNEERKILAFFKDKHLFLFNFHPMRDYTARIPVESAKPWKTVLHTNWTAYGGYKDSTPERIRPAAAPYTLEIPLDRRCAVVYRCGAR